jgi:hypothetical protein
MSGPAFEAYFTRILRDRLMVAFIWAITIRLKALYGRPWPMDNMLWADRLLRAVSTLDGGAARACAESLLGQGTG